MSLLTAIYKFIKPELTDAPPDITATNPNWDKLDATLKEIEDAHSSHLADNVRHITSAERTTWNEKQSALGYTPVNKSGDEMTGILTAKSNTSYTVRQVRNIILSSADADLGAMQNGDIWIKYK